MSYPKPLSEKSLNRLYMQAGLSMETRAFLHRLSNMSTIEQTLSCLQKSAFRAKFHLSEKDRRYIMDKGMETIQRHAADFIITRLAPANIPNDGRQTPMRGHPVFVAQHACACCCRGCLNKWYHVPIGRELTEDEQERIVRLLMAWVKRQLEVDVK